MRRNRYQEYVLRTTSTRALVSLILLPLLAVPAPLLAQTPSGLNIEIVEGEGAINNLQLRTAREVIVEVQDENHKPVSGALVTLAAHGGRGLTTSTLQATTDATGRVLANPLQLNAKPGNFEIQVKASYRGRTVKRKIHQRNVLESSAAAGAGAAAAAGGSAAGVQAILVSSKISTVGIVIIAVAATAGVIGGLFGAGVIGGGGKSATISVGAPHF